MTKRPQTTRQAGKPGSWARQVCPRWLFTVYDAAERINLSVGRTKALIRQHRIPTGMLKRRVKLGEGMIRTRYFKVLTPTSLELLLVKHAGLDHDTKPHRLRRRRDYS